MPFAHEKVVVAVRGGSCDAVAKQTNILSFSQHGHGHGHGHVQSASLCVPRRWRRLGGQLRNSGGCVFVCHCFIVPRRWRRLGCINVSNYLNFAYMILCD